MVKLFDLIGFSLEPIQTLEVEPAGLPDFIAEGRRRLHDLHVEVDVVTWKEKNTTYKSAAI